jgi:hypothetical protein
MYKSEIFHPCVQPVHLSVELLTVSLPPVSIGIENHMRSRWVYGVWLMSALVEEYWTVLRTTIQSPTNVFDVIIVECFPGHLPALMDGS